MFSFSPSFSSSSKPNQTTDRFLKWRKKSLFWLFTLLVLCSYRAGWCVAYISCHFIGSCSFCNNARDMRTQVSSFGSVCDFSLSFTIGFLVLSLFHLFRLESVIDVYIPYYTMFVYELIWAVHYRTAVLGVWNIT